MCANLALTTDSLIPSEDILDEKPDEKNYFSRRVGQ